MTHEQALAVFLQFKRMWRICDKWSHKVAECSFRNCPSRFKGKCFKCSTWSHRLKFFQTTDSKISQKSNQAIDLQKSENEDLMYALASCDGTAKTEYNVFIQ